MTIRMERFEIITKEIYEKVDKTVLKLGNLSDYVKNNFDELADKLPVTYEQIELEKLDKIEILELVSKGKVSPNEAKKFLDKIDHDEREMNSDKLCPFSGTGKTEQQQNTPRRICSRTGDPKKLGDCGSCRVAADWEEAFG